MTTKQKSLVDVLLERKGWYLASLFLLFLAAGAALHYPGLDGEMIYDSKAGIAGQSPIFESRDLRGIMGMVPGRPLFMLTLHLNFLLTGMDACFFRVTSLVILAGTGLVVVLLYVAIARTHRLRTERAERMHWIIGAAVGLVFVIHPLQVFVVEYIWQRQALLAAFFSLAVLVLYVTIRLGQVKRLGLAYGAVGTLFLAGLLTKESAISAPLMLVLAELILFPGNPRQKLYRLVAIALLCIPGIVLYGLVNQALQGPTTVHTRGVLNFLIGNYHMAQLTIPEVAATQCRVLWSYVHMVVTPFWGTFPLIKAEIASRSLWDPPVTAAAVGGVLGLVALGIGLRRKQPTVAFGILFFVVTSIPEGLLSPQYLFFGYRPVLFMVGLLLALGDTTETLCLQPGRGTMRMVWAIGLCVWAVCLAVVTVDQSRKWNPFDFWQSAFRQLPPLLPNTEQKVYEDVLINYGDQLIRRGHHGEAIEILRKAVRINPHLALAQLKLAWALREHGSIEEAIQSYRRALVAHPHRVDVHAELGEALISQGKTEEGITVLTTASALEPQNVSIRIKLGRALSHAGRMEEGIRTLRGAVNAEPSNAAGHLHLGLALKKKGESAEAIQHYLQSLRIDPRLALAHLALGIALEGQGNVRAAQESYRRALILDERSADAYYHLANCLTKNGDLTASIANFQKALELRPVFPEAQANLGVVLLQSRKVDEAVTYLEKALRHMPDNVELHNALGSALAEQGKIAQAASHFRKALEIEPGHPSATQNLEQLPKEQSDE